MKIRVNTASLYNTKHSVQSNLNSIKTNIELVREAMGYLNTMWNGDAYNATLNSVSKDLQFLQDICDGLQKTIIDYEELAVVEYSKCEQKVSGLVGQISV